MSLDVSIYVNYVYVYRCTCTHICVFFNLYIKQCVVCLHLLHSSVQGCLDIADV